jgi:hypothetical protein
MTSSPAELLPPDQLPSALAGERGEDVQFQQMKAWLPQYVAQAMSTVRILAGAGVALSEGLNQPMIYEP